ncbi:MAG: helix-turn-helix domain-containing protein [Ruminococcaceae bacterium]|nr:helix-turn-helix domain-containing protein [Oscillospiraceae bacterium]
MQFVNKHEIKPIVYGNFPVKILHDFEIRPNELAFPLHWHDRFELLLIKQGSLDYYCSTEHVIFKEGDVAIISPKSLHSAFAGADGVVYDVIMFNLDHFINGTIASKNFLTPLNDGNLIFETKTTNSEIVNQLQAIINADLHRNSYQPLMVLGYVYNLMGLLYEHCVTIENTTTNIEEKFGKVINYINKHFAEDISSSFLSSKFGYEEAYFCRKFKKNTGITVMKYIQVLRLEESKKLITKSDFSIKDIALTCGFSDVAYFTNCFKKLYQMTPTQMREQKIQK